MKFRYFITFIIALSLLLLPACTRSASTALPITTETGAALPVATEPTQAVVEKIISPTTKPTKPEATKAPQNQEKSPTAAASEVPSTSLGVATAEIQYFAPSAPEATAVEPAYQVFEGYGDGYPTFGIRGVVYNQTVTIQANDFPTAETYTVSMSRTDTNGVGAEEIATMETGDGGSYLVTFNIPESLYYVGSIAIRIDFPDGKYATNWFYNITTY